MNGFQINKWFASILIALLLGQVAYILGDKLIEPRMLAKNAYTVEGVDAVESNERNAAPPGPEPIELLLARANVEKGAAVAKKCLQCHSFEKGGPSKIGPNLWSIIGAKFAHVASFAYSNALKSKEGNWDVKALNHFLWKPQDFVRGTKMAFAGLKSPQDRADIVAYMNKMSDAPQDLSQYATAPANASDPAEKQAPTDTEAARKPQGKPLAETNSSQAENEVPDEAGTAAPKAADTLS